MASLTDAQARDLYPRVRRYAAALTRQDIEDLVQDAFLNLLRRAELPEYPAGFLCVSIRHALIARYRHDHCLRVDSLDASARFHDEDAEREGATAPLHARLASPDDVADTATTRVLLDGALAALAGEPYATAVVDYGLGYHYRELAARRGVSIMAIKSGVNRLRHGPIARLSPW